MNCIRRDYLVSIGKLKLEYRNGKKVISLLLAPLLSPQRKFTHDSSAPICIDKNDDVLLLPLVWDEGFSRHGTNQPKARFSPFSPMVSIH